MNKVDWIILVIGILGLTGSVIGVLLNNNLIMLLCMLPILIIMGIWWIASGLKKKG